VKAVRNYQNSRVVADRYDMQMLPRARKAYELMLRRYGLTLAYERRRNADVLGGRTHALTASH